MSETDRETAVAQALLDRFADHRLPRLLGIKQRVDQGEPLSEADLAFLEEVAEDQGQAKAMVEKYPDLQELYVKSAALYSGIMDKALENENKGSGG